MHWLSRVISGRRKNSCGNLFKVKARSSHPECTFFLTLFYWCVEGEEKCGRVGILKSHCRERQPNNSFRTSKTRFSLNTDLENLGCVGSWLFWFNHLCYSPPSLPRGGSGGALNNWVCESWYIKLYSTNYRVANSYAAVKRIMLSRFNRVRLCVTP